MNLLSTMNLQILKNNTKEQYPLDKIALLIKDEFKAT